MTLRHAKVNFRFGALFPNLIGTTKIKPKDFQNAKKILAPYFSCVKTDVN